MKVFLTPNLCLEAVGSYTDLFDLLKFLRRRRCIRVSLDIRRYRLYGKSGESLGLRYAEGRWQMALIQHLHRCV